MIAILLSDNSTSMNKNSYHDHDDDIHIPTAQRESPAPVLVVHVSSATPAQVKSWRVVRDYAVKMLFVN